MKPCCSTRTFVDADSKLANFFYRTLSFGKESRLILMSKIEQIIRNTIEVIENEKFNEHLSLTINGLYKASNGISNLLYTYDSDPLMKAKLRTQLQNIEIKINQYRYLIKGVRVDSEFVKIESNVNEIKDESVVDKKETETVENNQSLPAPINAPINLLDSNSTPLDLNPNGRRFRRPVKVKKSIDSDSST